MPGVRVHHPTLTSCTLIVPHPGGIEPDGHTRAPKDYVIRLDSEGDALVSETVWARLEQARTSGLAPHELQFENMVEDPPTLVLDQGGHADSDKLQQLRTYRQMPDAVTDENLLTIAQKFAPHGVGMNITTSNGGNS